MDEISAQQLFNYDDGLRELVLWLGYSDVRSSTQQMHVVMVKSAFAHAFFQGAHRDDGKMNVYACNKREILCEQRYGDGSEPSTKTNSIKLFNWFTSTTVQKASSNVLFVPQRNSFPLELLNAPRTRQICLMRTHFAAVPYSVEFADHNKSMWRYMMKEVNWARLKSDIQKKNRPFLVKYTADPTLLRLAGNQELIRPVNRNLQFWNMRHA